VLVVPEREREPRARQQDERCDEEVRHRRTLATVGDPPAG
jgi:hypothetical protein